MCYGMGCFGAFSRQAHTCDNVCRAVVFVVSGCPGVLGARVAVAKDG